MKRVIFKNTMNEKLRTCIVSNLESLLDCYSYIGFEPTSSSRRYMVLRAEPLRGIAIRPTNFWNTKKDPKEPDDGEYFVFETEKELLLWMAKAGTKE